MQFGRLLGLLALGAVAIVAGARCSARTDDGIACPAIVRSPPQLVVPAPGASGIPLAIGTLLVTSPADGKFMLESGTTSFEIGPVSNVPSPVPSDVPTYNPVSYFHDVAVPKLAPNRTYTLEYAPPYSNAPCGDGEGAGTGGTFTTGAS